MIISNVPPVIPEQFDIYGGSRPGEVNGAPAFFCLLFSFFSISHLAKIKSAKTKCDLFLDLQRDKEKNIKLQLWKIKKIAA